MLFTKGRLCHLLAFLLGAITDVHGIEYSVPESEEGLREIGLDSPGLVMDVVVRGVVAGNVLHGVPREGVSAVIIDGLDGGETEEEHALAHGHARKFVCQASTDGIEEEALEGVIVEGAVGIGDVETVVPRVEGGFERVVR